MNLPKSRVVFSAEELNARIKELFSIIREILERDDLLHRLHSGVVITGGGARLRNIDQILRHELGMDVRCGRPIHVDGFENEEGSEAFAAIAGALHYAHKNYEEKSIFDGILGRFFK